MSEANTTTPSSTMPPPEGCIDTLVLGHVLLIGINRPAKRNGWTPPMFRQLAEAYTRLDDDPELRVGVLHAMGDHFTAGLDLPAVSGYMQRGEKAIPEGLVEPHDYGLPGYRRRTKPMVVAGKRICFTGWALSAGDYASMAASVAVWGLGFASTNSMQQVRLVGAGPTLASASVSLNTSVLYIGQAIGSAIGGLLFAREWLYSAGYVAPAFVAAALAVVVITRPRQTARAAAAE